MKILNTAQFLSLYKLVRRSLAVCGRLSPSLSDDLEAGRASLQSSRPHHAARQNGKHPPHSYPPQALKPN